MLSWMYLVYIVCSAAVLSVLYRRNPVEGWVRWVIVSLFPVVGWVFPLFWPPKWRKGATTPIVDIDQFAEHVQSEVLMRDIHMQVEVGKELNVLPIEEALIVNTYQDRRKVMLDVLKQDALKYIDVLQKAVSNEDSETSHYAVSAVIEVKRKLTLSLQELSVQYEANKEDDLILMTYIDVLRDYMRSGFLDARTLRKHQFTYVSILEKWIDIRPDSDFAYMEKTETELQLGLYSQAEQTSQSYLERSPQQEEAYILAMKVYFHTKSHTRMMATLEQLKQSPLRLSHQALTMVRFWSEGA